jgi:WD40 repeat protein
LDEDLFSSPKTRQELLARRRSSLSIVNRRYDFTKNLFLAAGLADGKINIWNIDTGELTLILKDHQSTVCGLDFTLGTMQLASCSHDTTIKLWNLLDDGKKKKD